jgi:hypothetical protein
LDSNFEPRIASGSAEKGSGKHPFVAQARIPVVSQTALFSLSVGLAMAYE